MSFAQAPWTKRFTQMGDEAEAKFEEVCTAGRLAGGSGFTRYGLNRPDVNVGGLPLVIRYTPDYLTTRYFYECKGVGKDQKLKLKLDQLFALQWWDAILPVHVFIWDSFNERWKTFGLAELRRRCEKNGVLSQFPEGKPIFEIHCSALSDGGWFDES